MVNIYFLLICNVHRYVPIDDGQRGIKHTHGIKE